MRPPDWKRPPARWRAWSATLLLLALGASDAFAAGAELICPCRVEAVDHTALSAVFGVRSTDADTASGTLRLAISALTEDDVRHGLIGEEIAELHLGAIAAGSERPPAAHVTGVVVFDKPSSPAGLRMALWEDNAIVDSVRMAGTAVLSEEGGAAEESLEHGVGGLHLRGVVRVEAAGSTISATIPTLVNTSAGTARDLVVRVYATVAATLYAPYHLIYQEALDDEIAPGASLDDITVSGTRLKEPPGGFRTYQVAIAKAPPAGTDSTSWQPVYVWQTAVADGPTFPFDLRDFSLGGVDVLTDSDGDGVSDFNESRFAYADPLDPSRVPPASTIKLLAIISEWAAHRFGADVLDVVDDEIAKAQRVLDDSRVGIYLELAGVEYVELWGTAGEIARRALDRGSYFKDLDDWLTRHKADVPIVFRLRARNERYCGGGAKRGIAHRGDLIGSDGVAVVSLLCNPRTLPYELGYLMGLGASRREGGRGTFGWAVGHGVDGRFVTVMADRSAFRDAPEINVFSSPRLDCDGAPCGIRRSDPINGADAVAALEAVRFQVAAFRGAAPPTIVLNGGTETYAAYGSPFVEPGFVVEDDGDTGLEALVAVTGTVDTDAFGTHVLTYEVVDTDGNLATATRTVEVTHDTDRDGWADPVDTDDDGDGMSDQFEVRYGFNGLRADGYGDADGDGISNVAEYRAGTDPKKAADRPDRNRLVPYLPAHVAGAARQGFVRIINHSNRPAQVRIQATDDAGTRFEPLLLRIGRLATLHLNSRDLQTGNRAKGIPAGLGPGEGDWWLELSSAQDIEALAYIRTPDGFMAAMHESIPRVAGRYNVPTFNPGSNVDASSRLRLVNTGEEPADVTIRARDDAGTRPSRAVRLALPAHAARTLAAEELESGGADGARGRLGFGEGRWRLDVTATAPIVAMNLMEDASGRVANLASPAERPAKAQAVPFFPGADGDRQGYVRLINHAGVFGEVRIDAFDDAGRALGPSTLSLEPRQAIGFDATGLRSGDGGNGFLGTGSADVDLRLAFEADVAIEVAAYARTEDGFLTALDEPVPANANGHRIVMFNPARNAKLESRLRLVNGGDEATVAWIQAIDDAGQLRGEIEVALAARESRTITAAQLEEGGERIRGAVGTGTGKWQLMVTSEQPLVVMSLLANRTGHLTNLSAQP